ncbi:hypothetical protein GGI21_001193 [Coemansia aciculifera]|nr:hypothetical protein GGI21_001193 [Coemansia aciculifera]
MAKPRLLARAPAKQASNIGSEGSREVDIAAASADVARPRTAGGERSILRRLRIGRLFFGHGAGSNLGPGSGSGFASASVESTSAGAGLNASSPHSSHWLLRTSSAHAPVTTNDLLLLNHGGENFSNGDSQAIPYLPRQYTDSYAPHNSGNRKSRYSVHSRRLSAPDGVEMAHRQSLISLASDLGPESHSSSDYLPEISIVVSSTSDSQHSEALARFTSSAQKPNDAIVKSAWLPANLSTGSELNRLSQSDASYVDSFNTASSREAVAFQSLKNSASPLPLAHARHSGDDFIPIPSNAHTPIVTPATPQPADPSSTSESSEMAAQSRLPPPRSPAGRSLKPLGIERCIGGDMPLGVNNELQHSDNSHNTHSISTNASSLATLHPYHRSRPQALSVSMEAHKLPSGGRGLREHNASEALSMHKQRWQQSPALALQSLSLPTSPATPSQRVPPHLNAPCGIGSSATTDCDLPVILMGSVKQRGDKKPTRQSDNGDSAGPAALPLQYTDSESPSPDQSTDAPRPLPVSPALEPAAATDDSLDPAVHNDRWIRAALPSPRPKSLYEGGKLGDASAVVTELSSLRVSSSIASAKAFLTMIAADQARGSDAGAYDDSALTIVTSNAKGSFKYGSPGSSSLVSPALASAPVTGSAGRFGSTAQIANTTGAQDMTAAAESTERESANSSSPGVVGNRSLRVRSKLASVGIRRASTYVWSRSSVFMRGLASADELTSSQSPLPTEDAMDDNIPADILSIEPHLSAAGSTDVGPASTELDSAMTSSSAVALASKSAPAVMRLHAARELVMTEKNFVDNLFVIKKVRFSDRATFLAKKGFHY